jgi:hypothetical protein
MSFDLAKLIFSSLIIIAATLMLILPLLRYVIVGWQAKRNDIMEGLDADARLAYFEMFCRNCGPQDLNTVSAEFEKLYYKWYGRSFFLVPGILLFLVGLIEVTPIIFTVLRTQGYIIENPFFDVPAIGIAAIAGAYMWVVNDFISRARRLDFTPSDVLSGTLRLIIAVPMGYAFAAIASQSVGPFIAFAVGAFPLAELTSMLQRLANKTLGQASSVEASDDIIKLQGINRAIAERLSGEDITTVTHVGYCDPVKLSMRSNLSFNFVTDCMNQALAWMYFRDDLDKIRPLGMRGATEIKHLIDAYDDNANPDHNRAIVSFPLIAAILKQDPDTLQIVFREIAEDPFTIFLDRVWT